MAIMMSARQRDTIPTLPCYPQAALLTKTTTRDLKGKQRRGFRRRATEQPQRRKTPRKQSLSPFCVRCLPKSIACPCFSAASSFGSRWLLSYSFPCCRCLGRTRRFHRPRSPNVDLYLARSRLGSHLCLATCRKMLPALYYFITSIIAPSLKSTAQSSRLCKYPSPWSFLRSLQSVHSCPS